MKILGSHGVGEDMNLRRNELLGRPNEEAVRKPMPDPSYEHRGSCWRPKQGATRDASSVG